MKTLHKDKFYSIDKFNEFVEKCKAQREIIPISIKENYFMQELVSLEIYYTSEVIFPK